jgi:hypothetical protein
METIKQIKQLGRVFVCEHLRHSSQIVVHLAWLDLTEDALGQPVVILPSPQGDVHVWLSRRKLVVRCQVCALTQPD